MQSNQKNKMSFFGVWKGDKQAGAELDLWNETLSGMLGPVKELTMISID